MANLQGDLCHARLRGITVFASLVNLCISQMPGNQSAHDFSVFSMVGTCVFDCQKQKQNGDRAGPHPLFTQLCLLCEKVLEHVKTPQARAIWSLANHSTQDLGTERVQLASCFAGRSVLKPHPRFAGRACSTSILLIGDRAYSNRNQVLGTEGVQLASCFLGTELTPIAHKFRGPRVFKLASCILGTERTQIAAKFCGPHFQNTVEVKTHPFEVLAGLVEVCRMSPPLALVG